MKLLLEISFLGTAYCGYQVQPKLATVQGELNNATKDLFGFDCDIVGCSRTDSGVHANQFFATVTQKGTNTINTDIPIDKIAMALSVRLPMDIAVNRATFVDDAFHPRYDVKRKEYMYCVWNAGIRNPFLSNRAWHYARQISDEDIEKMRTAAELLVGTHDFSSFMASNSGVIDTVRTIYHVRIERNGDTIRFFVCGNGFLYNMVRIIVGTLICVAEGKIHPSEISTIIESHDRTLAGMTAPAHGLYLNRVEYR